MGGKETMTVQISSVELKQAGVKGFVSKARVATDLIPAIKIALSGGDYWGMEAAAFSKRSYQAFHKSGGYKRYSGKGVGLLAAADLFQETHAYGICQQFDRRNLDMGDLGLRKPYAILKSLRTEYI
jgi:hypothetical protein